MTALVTSFSLLSPPALAFNASLPHEFAAIKCQSTVAFGNSCCPNTQAFQQATNDGEKAKACLFGKYLNPVINLLSAVVGVVVVIGIIVGAVQFSSSAGDPQKAANGKNHIRNSLLGLLAYLLLYAFLQFIIPGGTIN